MRRSILNPDIMVEREVILIKQQLLAILLVTRLKTLQDHPSIF